MAKLDELKDMFEDYAENYGDLKDVIKDVAEYRQEKEREQRKKTKEKELIYSTVRGKYGDRNEAHKDVPETEFVASTIPTAEKWKVDAKDAITYAELEKLLEQEYAAQALAEQMGDRDAFELYLNGSSSGDKSTNGRLSMDNDVDLEKEWEKEQKRRKTAEKEKALKPAEIKKKEYPSKLEAFFFGYDPDSNGEEGIDIDVIDAGYAVPVLGSAMYGGTMLDQVKRGGMPGFVDAAISVPIIGPGVKKAGKAFANGFRRGRARRFAKGMESKEGKNILDYARTQLFDREGNLVGEW